MQSLQFSFESYIYSTGLESIYKIQKEIVRIATFPKFTQETRPIYIGTGLYDISVSMGKARRNKLFAIFLAKSNALLLSLFLATSQSGNLLS